MRQIRALRVAAVAAGIALMATGCGATGSSSTNTSTAGADAGPVTGLQIMVPNTPGGGYDTTARAAAKVLDDEKISTNTEVFNLAGAGFVTFHATRLVLLRRAGREGDDGGPR